MTVYSMGTVARYWELAGGAPAHRVAAVAVCYAESHGDSSAISPAQDYGLWQINIRNFHYLGLTTGTVRDPKTNARAAVIMSGNGTNWAPWCTCWVNPARDCGHGHLGLPQHGSPADGWLHLAASTLRTTDPGFAPAVPHPGINTVHSSWGGLQNFVGPWGTGQQSHINATRQAIRKAR